MTGLIDAVTASTVTVNGLTYERDARFDGSWPGPESVGRLYEFRFAETTDGFSVAKARVAEGPAERPLPASPARIAFLEDAMDRVMGRAMAQGLELEALAELVRLRFQKRPCELDVREALQLIEFLGD